MLVQLGEAVLAGVNRSVRRVHCTVVVSEEKSSGVGLVDIVVEVATTTCDGHRIPVRAGNVSEDGR